MKKIVLLALLLTVGLGFGQGNEAPVKEEKITTTIEEYNYLTIGYADDLAKGKDLKNGYELKEFHKFDKEKVNFSFTYHKFIETKTNKTKAILVVAKKKSKNKIKYICIPFNNRKLIKDSATEAAILGASMTYIYNQVNFKVFSDLLNDSFNK
ncbi:MAG: hypothetical protein COA88_15780 [Kordia sp.]|nr:MAG: hypothetical protein COA88_15780 [Kordia sp.]